MKKIQFGLILLIIFCFIFLSFQTIWAKPIDDEVIEKVQKRHPGQEEYYADPNNWSREDWQAVWKDLDDDALAEWCKYSGSTSTCCGSGGCKKGRNDCASEGWATCRIPYCVYDKDGKNGKCSGYVDSISCKWTSPFCTDPLRQYRWVNFTVTHKHSVPEGQYFLCNIECNFSANPNCSKRHGTSPIYTDNWIGCYAWKAAGYPHTHGSCFGGSIRSWCEFCPPYPAQGGCDFEYQWGDFGKDYCKAAGNCATLQYKYIRAHNLKICFNDVDCGAPPKPPTPPATKPYHYECDNDTSKSLIDKYQNPETKEWKSNLYFQCKKVNTPGKDTCKNDLLGVGNEKNWDLAKRLRRYNNNPDLSLYSSQCNLDIAKYACDTKKHTCYIDFKGPYDSSAACSQECSLYKCDTTTYQCVRDNKGTYTGISQCLDNCKAPSKYACDSKNHICYLDFKGSYDSSAACYQECALYKCDTTTYQCIQDNKNGTYTGISQCSDNCKKPNPQEPILVGYRCNKDICTEDKESGLKSCTCQAVYDNDEWYKTHPNSPLLYNNKSQCKSQCYILPPATDCSIHWFDLDPQNVSIYSLWKQGKIPRMTWYAPNCDYCTLDVTYRSIWDKDKSVKTLKSDPQLFKDILDPYYPDLSLQFPKLGHYLPINSDQLRDYFKNDDNYKGNRNIYNVFQNSLVNPDDPPIKNKKEGVYTYTLTCSNNTNHTSDTLSQVVNIFPYIIWREMIPVLPKELGYEMDLKTPYNPALHPEEQQIHDLYNLDK